MPDPLTALKRFRKQHDFLVAVDSDGCAFDTMELKCKECFIPNIIRYWDLQPVSKFARAAAEFVFLYSQWRGINRFPGLIRVFDLLKDWPEALERRAEIPKAGSLREWIRCETRLGDPALTAEVERTGDPELKQALEWSRAINRSVAQMVRNCPPFPFVRESLARVFQQADLLVCSVTQGEALRREWQEHDLARYAAGIAGQEAGSKQEQIQTAAHALYAPARILMIGDAPGDLAAARACGARFFPINPGHEDASWERFFTEGAERFLTGEYTAEYESLLIADFDKLLPEVPPWKI